MKQFKQLFGALFLLLTLGNTAVQAQSLEYLVVVNGGKFGFNPAPTDYATATTSAAASVANVVAVSAAIWVTLTRKKRGGGAAICYLCVVGLEQARKRSEVTLTTAAARS